MLVGDVPAQIVAIGPRRVLAIVPETSGGELEVRLQSGAEMSEPARLQSRANSRAIFIRLLIRRLILTMARSLSRVRDRAARNCRSRSFVSTSAANFPNTRATFPIRRESPLALTDKCLSPAGSKAWFTGSLPFKEAVAFARNLGVATGMAFDRSGLMYVGDRTGTIFKVNGIGEERAWTQIEPSVSAFHLAFGPDDALYVTGPTVTSFDCIWRINPDGEIDVFFKGLGRPQGLAFDRDGNLVRGCCVARAAGDRANLT